ncbi:L-fuculokinase [Cellulomonas sp. KRMCY2]|uniref:FGGY-family carbohydrate kinase n=1 Tax=Cellulomonas sp. KRMCY2 TaxID=1304865 RepID=UPI00045EBAC6|nr:FGGY family carbohydrate kinase [Cellulomonas sp. KRMCY2]
MADLVAGLDLGSTGIKILIADRQGQEVLLRQVSTPWRDCPHGATELDADDLLASVRALLADVADGLAEVTGDAGARISALAVSGMGETGFLLGSGLEVVSPGIAWFDPRGADQVRNLPAALREQFAGRTGLPLGAQVTVAKLLLLRDEGLTLAGTRWANLPEFVAASLGARLVGDVSLVSRTGLLDQDTGRPWPEMLAYLGVDATFLPPLVPSGADLGAASGVLVPAALQGARLTVAGHDHLVSAVSGGLTESDRYHVSMGTAEVLLRVVDSPLDYDARSRLGAALINCVHHVVPGKHVLVAGVKTGLLMRRALQLVGITDAAGRDALDAAVLALDRSPGLVEGAVEVHGARNDDGMLSLTIRADGVTPAEVFRAVLRHGNEEISRLIEVMDHEVRPARSTLLTGGWVGMQSVCGARAEVLPGMNVSTRSQDTAFGAAMFAARLGATDRALSAEH